MRFRDRRILRDRAEGIVFNWRRHYGATKRWGVAVVVAFVGALALASFVDLEEPVPFEGATQAIDLTLVDLDQSENAWLANLMERNALFHRRWEIRDSSFVEKSVAAAFEESNIPPYRPTLRAILPPEPVPSLPVQLGQGLGSLPDPEPVAWEAVEIVPEEWWIKVAFIDGPAELPGFQFQWTGEERLSEGDWWVILLGVDAMGQVIFAEPSIQEREEWVEATIAKLHALAFETLSEEASLRVWKVEARVINRASSR